MLIKPLTQQGLCTLLSEQQAIRVDMQEIQLMAVGQSQVLTTLIDELQRSNGADRQQLLATTAQPDVFAAVLHRLKGSFALAGYQSGVNLCQQLEQHSPASAEPTVALLRMNTLILRFIALLEQQRAAVNVDD
jgi:two-component system sensor histidine kinase EvgS